MNPEQTDNAPTTEADPLPAFDAEKAKVRRANGNTGDVLVSLAIDGLDEPFAVPGDCSAYSAIHALKPFLERVVDKVRTPAKVETAFDPETGFTSILVNNVERARFVEATEAEVAKRKPVKA